MSKIGIKINGSNSEIGRSLSDFYPTPHECTEALLFFMSEISLINDDVKILEPCCGDGAISKVLTYKGYNVTSSDLRQDSGYGDQGVDFIYSTYSGYDLIITNPPFSIADKIIQKSLGVSPVVCMLLKAQYFNAKKRLSLFKENQPRYVLPLTWRPDFTGQGGALMDMMWVIWDGKSKETIFYPLEKPKTNSKI